MSEVKNIEPVKLSENTQYWGWTREQVELIKRTVAQGATDAELAMFLYQAKKYNLDPLMKEIVFVKFKDRVSIITTRDGYLKIAQQHNDFLGIISFTVCEGDEFEIDAANYAIKHKFGAKRGRIIGAWARVDRKGYKPFIAYVNFDEYCQDTAIWKKYPSAMIQKVAEAFALKRAFNISGLVTREELGETYEDTYVIPIKEDIVISHDVQDVQDDDINNEHEQTQDSVPSIEGVHDTEKVETIVDTEINQNNDKESHENYEEFEVKKIITARAKSGRDFFKFELENADGQVVNAVSYVKPGIEKIIEGSIIEAKITDKNGLKILDDFRVVEG